MRKALAAPCHLQVERGPAAGLVLPFAGNYCALGRPQLHDRAVSREHLLFISQQDKLRVRDLGSANGTFRGALTSCFSRIRQEQEIGASSRIRAGNTVLKVCPRPRALRVTRPRPKPQLGSWRQWLFLPMLAFLPLSLTSLLRIPPLTGLLVFAGIAALGMGVWWYHHPRPVSPAQLLLVASQPEPAAPRPVSFNEGGEVGAWISPHRVVRGKAGDKLCFTGNYARERALWWAAQLAWQEGARYRLDLAVTAADFTCGDDNYPPDTSGYSEETTGEDALSSPGYPNLLLGQVKPAVPRVILVSPSQKPVGSGENIWVTWAKTSGQAPVWANRIIPVPTHRRATRHANLPSLFWCRLLTRDHASESAGKLADKVAFRQLWPQIIGAATPLAAIRDNWKHSQSLQAPVALDAQGVSYLDLVKDGPHALLAGTTGAGKSAALITWLLSLALSHPPSKLQYVLVDYKGGDAFQKLQSLPHVLGILTDLEPALTRRAILSLNAEIKYREQHKNRQHPRIVVVVDEFRVLATDHPDLLDSLIRLATLGRSLGIHLILATQRPAGIVDGQIKSNMALRICLRVLETADSGDVLGDGRGAQLPAIPGRAWIKSATDSSGKQVQFAWIPHVEQAEQLAQLCRSAWHPPTPARLPWAAPLPRRLTLAQLPPAVDKVILGLGDYPHRQCTAPLMMPPSFSLHVVGSVGSGRTTIALMVALQLANRGREVHVICTSPQDFFGPSFSATHQKTWPGTIATTPQVSLELLKLASRGELSGTLIIDDCEDLLDSLERTYGPLSGNDLLARLCRQSEALGISLMVVTGPSGASARLFQGLKTQIVGGIRDGVQAAQAGFTPQVLEQISEAGIFVFSPSRLATPFRAAMPPIPEGANFLASPQVRLQALPTRFYLPKAHIRQGSDRAFALGLSGPLSLGVNDFERDWLIIGDHSSGKTNTVHLLANFLPDHKILEDLNAHDPRLLAAAELATSSSPQTQSVLALPSLPSGAPARGEPVIASVSPEVVQTTFSGPLSELRQRAILVILGSAAQCRPFLKGINSQALPDQIGLVPGRGIIVKNGKGLAIQIAIYPKLR